MYLASGHAHTASLLLKLPAPQSSAIHTLEIRISDTGILYFRRKAIPAPWGAPGGVVTCSTAGNWSTFVNDGSRTLPGTVRSLLSTGTGAVPGVGCIVCDGPVLCGAGCVRDVRRSRRLDVGRSV